ncbi:bumetanide-sensitive sodium-(potassium)-chloride cotransporter-like isoform X3 [Schistocerca gregaria]|uniref:bumetanide-sensitive sodium-(potassium)-chloride cotransporter-like isoform X3 n=1 Tax=Schistocerca gregaria TaxID=7010 RepID=UPI00211ECDCA|nr:bumetanide-sensitive sodium-(potassium)-chloride cotransporter-like isoform X3 [Schistocerca gregaria]
MSSKELENKGKRKILDIETGNAEKRTRFQVNPVDSVTLAHYVRGNRYRGTDSLREIGSASLTTDTNLSVSPDSSSSPSSDVSGNDSNPGKSFRHFTREVLPRLENYRNVMSIHAASRPTLDELHNATVQGEGKGIEQFVGASTEDMKVPVKFGWIQGVLVRNLLSIWGIMLFLRLSWVVGQAGIVQGLLLILSTSAVTVITGLSMSAISTNGIIKGGGMYYTISRSLGPEFGGSIGLILSLANALACAMYVVGFSESLNDLLDSYGLSIVDGGVNDMRITGVVTVIALLCIVVLGMEWEAKTQLGLLVILIAAILDYTVGSFIGPQSNEAIAKGFLGFNVINDNFLTATLISQNLHADYRVSDGVDYTFFSVFAVFFPAATGFLAGANISGDLKDPEVAIPKGTLLSIFITTVSYLFMAFIAGATVVRDASGNVHEISDQTFLNCTGRTCKWGLQNSFTVVELVSAFGPLIYAGCFAASLSSALSSLISAPKIFQALAKDKLYPYIEWFSKGYGKNNEPIRGYILTFVIAVGFILTGDLNIIAPLISNFFLATYALINFSTFHASLVKPIGWRPKFRYYNMWICLLGSTLCVSIMFLISWWTALITLGCILALYLVVSYRNPDVNWGSSTQAQTYKYALLSVQQLNQVLEHVKNYNPQILVLTGRPSQRPPLVHFAHLITKNSSLLICGHIIKTVMNRRQSNRLKLDAQSWFQLNKIKAFYTYIDETDFKNGASALLQTAGIGKLKPNILLVGYKADWQNCEQHDLSMYFSVIHKALDMHIAVCILRLQEGISYSNVPSEPVDVMDGVSGDIPDRTSLQDNEKFQDFAQQKLFSECSQGSSVNELTEHLRHYSISTYTELAEGAVNMRRDSIISAVPFDYYGSKSTVNKQSDSRRDSQTDLFKKLSKETLENLTLFQKFQNNGTIDVWWLYDDGGLTLLLPYIISTRSNWSSCKLRIFTLANKKDELEMEQRSMASLLAKFRIDYSDVKVITDITRKPQESTYAFFNELISGFKLAENNHNTGDGVHIKEEELRSMADKTNRHIRLRELMMENSNNANLIVMTLPMPRKNAVSAALYMAWLETLTNGMPPFLLVRGNQSSVLTFYS